MVRGIEAAHRQLGLDLRHMLAFFFRLSALAIRFLCPLTALALSNAETMGKYYLFISYFTFVVGVSALELAVPFSRKFLRCKSDSQRRLVFTGFLANQIVVTMALAVPAGILVAGWAGVPTALIPLFCLSLATEACVNEVGRFFWNIGEWKMPSLRDLIRAVIFTAAIVGSVFMERDVLTAVTFVTIAVGNLCIVAWELRSWGHIRCGREGGHPFHLLKAAWLRVRRSLTGSLPQFVHMQLLGLQPLLERTLVEKSQGLIAVAAFSFLTSVMQSAAGLLLVPMVATVRQGILGARMPSDFQAVRSQALLLLARILAVSGLFAVGIYFFLPIAVNVLEKKISVSISLVVVAYLVSVSAIFSSAISPLLTVREVGWRVNAVCVIAIFPLILLQLVFLDSDFSMLGFLVMALVAVVQIGGRVFFVLRLV